MCLGTHPSFSAMFSKGDNFCDTVCLHGERRLPKMGSTLKRKEFTPMGANSFLYEMTSIYAEGNNQKDR